ncbi:MAG: FAD-binding oxidoreductase [Deinococcota bacterium]
MIDIQLRQALEVVVGKNGLFTEGKPLQVMSKDHYWFSPVLKAQLDGKLADAIVAPRTTEQLLEVVKLAVKHDVPITMRGSGTGNYGQGVPLRGGLVLSTHLLKEILELTPDYAHVQAGVKLGTIEREARPIGGELRMYPSTYATATAGGFLAGGSGGIGSITWGSLWDEGNVLGATVVTIEDKPRVLNISDPDALLGVIHSCGVTGIISELTLALAPATPWAQYVAAFDDLTQALDFGHALAADTSIPKRLLSLHEDPLPSYYPKLAEVGAAPAGKTLALMELVVDETALTTHIKAHNGALTWQSPHEEYHTKGITLSDFTWNHTTLWAMKADPTLTYLQDGFDASRVYEQLALRSERFGDDLMHHIEFTRGGGRKLPTPGGMTVVRYRSQEQLYDIINYSEEVGMRIADPHSYLLDNDVRWNGQPILDAKQDWDPHGLLNPGKLSMLEKA